MTDPSHATTPRAYLASLEVFGIKLGLSTIEAIAAALGHPERRRPAVLIAGTNGKGSVAAMLERALRAAGHRTGRYTSPHLVRLEERIALDGQPVHPEVLDEAILRVRLVANALRAAGSLTVHPTFFEVTTAAAFDVFDRAAVDIAVLEVGLGGRFDATNVAAPMAVAITSIALDHEQQLGNTLEAIAFEKAGVIRPRVPVVIGSMPLPARAVIRGACDARQARLVDVTVDTRVDALVSGGVTSLRVRSPVREYPWVTLALRGAHQVSNAVVAVRLLESLEEEGIRVGQPAIVAGLQDVRWPARLELVPVGEGREVLVDGAHNPAGAAALASYLDATWPAGLPIVFGVMRDKQIAGMVRALAGSARPLIATTAPGERAAPAADVAAIARAEGLAAVEIEAELEAALAAAWRHGPLAVVAGSLFLAGRTLEWLDHV